MKLVSRWLILFLGSCCFLLGSKGVSDLSTYVFPQTGKQFEYVSVLMVVPHGSSNKANWEVVLAEGKEGRWGAFVDAKAPCELDMLTRVNRLLLQEALFDGAKLLRGKSMARYCEESKVYTWAFPDGHIMNVICFSEEVIDAYISSFYNACYHQKKGTRYGGANHSSSFSRLALVRWSDLVDACKVGRNSKGLSVKAKMVVKHKYHDRRRYCNQKIELNPLLTEQFSYPAKKASYVAGKRPGIRIYS